MAAALLHEPELLILDEPTVGVDPLLRQCIWTHLLEISRSSQLKTTIVITTHYIEEARQANVVGMMRFGRLLAEDHPDTLLEQYGMNSLEDVFLHLCVGDEAERWVVNDDIVFFYALSLLLLLFETRCFKPEASVRSTFTWCSVNLVLKDCLERSCDFRSNISLLGTTARRLLDSLFIFWIFFMLSICSTMREPWRV